jgi:hypothetical protein
MEFYYLLLANGSLFAYRGISYGYYRAVHEGWFCLDYEEEK